MTELTEPSQAIPGYVDVSVSPLLICCFIQNCTSLVLTTVIILKRILWAIGCIVKYIFRIQQNVSFQGKVHSIKIIIPRVACVTVQFVLILEDPGAVSRVGGKGWTKVFKHGQKSPWVPTLTKLFPKIQADARS